MCSIITIFAFLTKTTKTINEKRTFYAILVSVLWAIVNPFIKQD